MCVYVYVYIYIYIDMHIYIYIYISVADLGCCRTAHTAASDECVLGPKPEHDI